MRDPLARRPFDLDSAKSAIGAALFNMLKLAVLGPGQPPDHETGRALMDSLKYAIQAGSEACAEVTRMRDELTSLRDTHRPQPHADTSKPGALCAACSVHGSLVAWPCATWSAAERILTHGKA